MEARTLKFVAAACAGGQFSGDPEVRVTRVCSDSRQAQAGDLFFALSGDRFDGHDYLGEVARKGVAAVVVERGRVPASLSGCAIIPVEDTRQALGRLAQRYRADFDLPVVAVGGSNGKTTTKELVAAVLKQKLAVLWSEASFNNDIGVPVTLLRLSEQHRAAVLEVGTNHPGELAPLIRMIQPKHAIITNIGREHLEFFGDLAGVAGEEGWLAELLPAAGKLFLHGDGEWCEGLARRTSAAVVRVGFGTGNDWRARDARLNAEGMSFHVEGPVADFNGEYRIGLLGRHQVVNALFAVAAGVELGLSAAEIRRGLTECKPAKMRLQSWNWNGVCVLDDAYNANADSMLAALETLREMPCSGRRVAVLGDMAELGAYGPTAHEEVGRRAAEVGVDQLFTVGSMAGVIARAARKAGLGEIGEFESVPDATAAVRGFLRSGDVLLLKASRSARLERLSEALRSEAAIEKA